MHHLLPLSYDEFITWYRLGTKRIPRTRLHKVTVRKHGDIKRDGTVVERVMADLPDYEDDWQVLLVQLELDAAPRGTKAQDPIECELLKVRAIFPLSERGHRVLATKLDPQVRLEQPQTPFLMAFTEEDEKRQRALAFRGGRALLDCFGLGTFEKQFDDRKEAVWRAVMLRHQETPFPVQNGSFITNLFCYDRHEARYPRTSIGFAYDLGKVVLEHAGADAKVRDVLTRFKSEALSGNDSREWGEQLDLLRPHLQKIGEFTQGYSGIACVAFFEMQERLRAEPSVQTLAPLHNLLREKHEHDLALALWLAGVFFDFTPFASEYYQRTHAPFIRPDSKPGPERGKGQMKTSPKHDHAATPDQISQECTGGYSPSSPKQLSSMGGTPARPKRTPPKSRQ